ncbi:hypothetical protein DL897_01380 [Thermoflavimicrobium daqui]|jgi:hypothetical protein|uniref:Uncharacterized protein n=1 Tax=Thermoflavimicrobium daqui TaxID=2137476 RepID=A0A364K8W0_9BACL|nr:hypothetical protein DL897_01380 [Thermoflavimicrobium daqui]
MKKGRRLNKRVKPKLGKETFGDKPIEQAFYEAFSPFFQSGSSLQKELFSSSKGGDSVAHSDLRLYREKSAKSLDIC